MWLAERRSTQLEWSKGASWVQSYALQSAGVATRVSTGCDVAVNAWWSARRRHARRVHVRGSCSDAGRLSATLHTRAHTVASHLESGVWRCVHWGQTRSGVLGPNKIAGGRNGRLTCPFPQYSHARLSPVYSLRLPVYTPQQEGSLGTDRHFADTLRAPRTHLADCPTCASNTREGDFQAAASRLVHCEWGCI